MANFIRDIRKDLGVKNLPFVIAETGMSGPEEKHPRALSLMKAQAAVAEYKEFQGNVAFVGTRAFWRDKEVSPTGQGFHWNTNAETYYLIGEAMGKAMTKLCASNAKSNNCDFEPDQSKLPAQAPKNAIVLLDKKGNHLFLSMSGEKIDWPIKDGVLVPTPKGNKNHIVSKLHFRDADIHVEFMLPEKGPGNSGVYIHGHYEVQILNSFGKEAISQEDAGAIYGFSKPIDLDRMCCCRDGKVVSVPTSGESTQSAKPKQRTRAWRVGPTPRSIRLMSRQRKDSPSALSPPCR